MTTLQQFRVWRRRSTSGTRAAAATAAIVAAGLLAWLITPVHDTSQIATSAGAGTTGTTIAGTRSAQGAPTDAASSDGSPATGGVASMPGAPGGAAANAGGPASSKGCVSPPGSAPGVTATQINIAIVLVNIFGPAANSTVGVPGPAEQQQDYEQVIADTNARGGVACRKLVAKFYEGNPADSSQQQQQCLNIIQSHPFAVIDFGGYTQPLPAKECFAVQGPVPYLGTGGLTDAEMDKFFPYLLSVGETADTVERDGAYALAARGFFDPAKGFKKLGMVYRDCPPELPKKMIDNLHAVGVPDSQIVTYDVGCPSGFASPSDIQQAILKFQSAGVTHMTAVDFTADWTTFTKVAQQQGFRPKWGIPDEGQVAISKGNLAPDYDNIADAIAITGLGWGQDNTTLPLSPGTVRCNAIFKAANRPDVYHQQVGSGGVTCSHIWTFKAAVEHAPSLDRAALGQGLQNAGLIQISWPNGDNTRFRPGRNTAGGGFWRPLQFFRDCRCWKPIDPVFRPSFS